jgi:hypothetical protein
MNEAPAAHRFGDDRQRRSEPHRRASAMMLRETSMQIKFLAREGMEKTKIAERLMEVILRFLSQ